MIYSNFDYWEYEIAILDGGFHEKSTLATSDVPDAIRLAVVSDNRAFPRLRPVKFCTIEGYLHVAGMSQNLRVCFRDTTGDSQVDQYSAIDSPPAWRKWRNIKTARPTIQPLEAGAIDVGFKRELSYSGRAGDIISLSYREYTEEGLARPAFTQDVSYTLEREGETKIGFRGARILVHVATNDRIVFTVEQGFKE